MSGTITSGLQQRHFSRYPVIPTQVGAVSHELRCPVVRVFIIQLQLHLSAPSLAKSSRTDSVQLAVLAF